MAMDLFWAFLVGGALCAVGQVLIDYTKLTPARILTAYVVAGVALSAVGIYPKLVELAGGGASVPLTGFGNLLAEGVRESVDEKGLLGIFMGGLTASSAGITAAMVFGPPRIFGTKYTPRSRLLQRILLFSPIASNRLRQLMRMVPAIAYLNVNR